MIRVLLLVGLGGGIGSAARYLLGLQMAAWFGAAFPWGTLAVNILGGLIMGSVMAAVPAAEAPTLRAFLAVGVLGGFTTFSAFAWETVALAERGAYGLASVYVGASVMLAILALIAGLALTRWLLGCYQP